MKHAHRILPILLLSLFLLSACTVNAPADDGKLSIVTTTGMITDVTRNIAGDKASVISLMGPGVDPHLYRASEGDVSRLMNADIIFYNGLHLEAKMAEIFENMESKKTVAVAESIPTDALLSPPEFQGLHDPHVWFDVSLWAIAAGNVRDELIAIDPANEEHYRSNADSYLAKLTALHEDVKQKAAQIPQDQRVLITAHDAFNYFGKQYGFEVKGLQGISTASEAGAQDVQNLARFISDRKIKAIFVESSVPERNILAVKEAVSARGWNVAIGGSLFSDAMGDEGTLEGTYIGMITHNIDTITSALK
jgi:manganese/zinc/iron transport system substrate-binding protein